MQWTIRESPNRTNLQEINMIHFLLIDGYFFSVDVVVCVDASKMQLQINICRCWNEEMLLIWANIAIRHPERFGPVDGGVSKQHVIWFLHSESPPFHFLTLFSAYFFFLFSFLYDFFLGVCVNFRYLLLMFNCVLCVYYGYLRLREWKWKKNSVCCVQSRR